MLDAEGYPVAKLSDDQEGEDIGTFIQAAANFARAYLEHLAAQESEA